MMNERDRYLATITFQKPDRIPFYPGDGRKSTLEAWHRQGLPAEVQDYHAYVRELIGLPAAASGPVPQPRVDPGVNFRMIPQFEEQVLEHRPSATPGTPGVLVVQDWKGNVCEISDQYDVSYLRNAIDFVTRAWVRCPVTSRSDWPDMARRYQADDPARFPADFAARGIQLQQRTYVSGVCVNGPFWQLREWLGFEGLCMLLLDDPDFALEMIDFWKDFIGRMLERVFQHFIPDGILICEDMAYKEKPMIGPEMARRFLLPSWKQWIDQARAAGVRVIEVDSDGYVGSLIPLWIDAGFNLNSPQEVAAGNDPVAYHRQFGTAMAYRGGVDKRLIATGGAALRREFDRLRPALDAGGFIPSCDHGIPSDVSWPNFVEYCRLLAHATGWL
jgi:uroporphyrinogen decarboxylase